MMSESTHHVSVCLGNLLESSDFIIAYVMGAHSVVDEPEHA